MKTFIDPMMKKVARYILILGVLNQLVWKKNGTVMTDHQDATGFFFSLPFVSAAASQSCAPSQYITTSDLGKFYFWAESGSACLVIFSENCQQMTETLYVDMWNESEGFFVRKWPLKTTQLHCVSQD